MFRKNTLWISIMPVLLGLALLLAFGQAISRPVAQADSTSGWEEGRPVTSEATLGDIALPSVQTAPGVLYRTFSGTRFQPTSSALTYSAMGGAIYATALPAGGFSFSLDFDLPAGATITEVVFFVIDNDATNMDLSLRSYRPETDAFAAIASATSSGASPTLQIVVLPVNPPVQVDNTTTAYRLRVAPGVASAAHLLRGARIGYTVPVLFLPLIAR